MKPAAVHYAIEYVVRRSPRPLLKTQVVKLLYLADLEALCLYGKSLTGAKYIKDYYGPNAPVVESAITSMLQHEIAVEERVNIRGYQYYLHSAGPAPRFEPNLEPHQVRLLDFVLASYAMKTLDDLKQAAYCTLPWLRSARQELKSPLDLGCVCGTRRPPKPNAAWLRDRIRRASAKSTQEDQVESLLQVFAETEPLRQAANSVVLGDP